ncbi:ATP-binding protein [Streptococcus suis]|nr:ATP-binding protein [Streptococcus suis]NQP67057.1 ATP-binding protein [Streptococcus suis]HEM5494889.1 ATP-binding protein [Streptococcus suis]
MDLNKTENVKGFSMGFDPNTIDHLGIKLYSQFPPVLAELVSNAYDAEAENVIIKIDRENNLISIKDDGVGMTHNEINEAYLVIGRNRRVATNSGKSKNNKRFVTGKKGLGKLAIFGIAKTIIITSVSEGLKNSLKINYDNLKGTIPPYKPEALVEYEETSDGCGTEIVIEDFTIEISSLNALAIGLAKRFNFFDDSFKVTLVDDNDGQIEVSKKLYTETIETQFSWTFPDDFQSEINEKVAYKFLNDKQITGKISTASTPLRKMDQGFNVYARGKIAAQNTFFNDRSNDNFNQYVFGSFNIDVLDEDNQEDVIGTARQTILWEQNEDLGKIKNYLDTLIKDIEKDWRKKRAEQKNTDLEEIIPQDFYEGLSKNEKAQINRIKKSLLTNSVDKEEVKPILDILASVKDLFGFQSFQEYVGSLSDSELTVENIEKISNDWEQIEAKELAKIAVGRIAAINQFEKFVREDASETKAIQPFLEKFPWILNPRITTFERELTFKKILEKNFPDRELEESNKRLDFLCYLTNGELVIIELKRPRIKIGYKEIDQALNYQKFLETNHKDAIASGVSTFLVSDNYEIKEDATELYPSLEKTGRLKILSYSDLLVQARKYNEEFINLYDNLQEKLKNKKTN